MTYLDLDPPFGAMGDGEELSIKAVVLMKKHGMTICRTTINRQLFSTTISLGCEGEFSLLDGILKRFQGHYWIEESANTKVLNRPCPDMTKPLSSVEVCAGIGAGCSALRECGINVKCLNEMNPKFCQWLEANKRADQTIVQGDINQADVIERIAQSAPDAQMLGGGVSCQPFSALGDRLEGQDSRSVSFTGTLKAAFHLNVAWIVLECTKEARYSTWAQGVLNAFCSQTGFRLSQSVLDLHKFWPGHRTRWWAILSHPMLPQVEVPQMPSLPWIPTILHVAPGVMPLTTSHLQALTLDVSELRIFNSTPKGIHAHLLNLCKPMPTATHSWGSQTKACECGCRSSGFTESRIRDKGLYGQVVPLGDEIHTSFGSFQLMRHLHPQEVALFSGLDPLSAVWMGRFAAFVPVQPSGTSF